MKGNIERVKLITHFLGCLLVLLLFLVSNRVSAQWMLINESGGTPDSTAVLELRDTARGFLPPRLSQAQMDSIQGPANGLFVFNTDSSAYYFYTDSTWKNVAESGTPADVSIPAGSIIPFGGDSANIPKGFLLCNGTSLSTSAYSDLFDAIGYSWGGSGGNFNLPDLRVRFLRGVDRGAGNDPDAGSRTAITTGGNTADNVGSYQSDQFRSHNHTYMASDVVGFVTTSNYRTGNGTNARTGSVNNPGGNETRPINANVNYIICYSSSLATADSSDLSSLNQGLASVLSNGNDGGGDSIVGISSLGINTSSPQDALHIDSVGGILYTNGASFNLRSVNGILMNIDHDSNGVNSNFRVRANANDDLFMIDEEGNVGIRNNNPIVDLDIEDTTASIRIKSTRDPSWAGLRLETPNSNYLLVSGIGNTSGMGIRDQVRNYTPFVIESNGYVGLGTTEALRKLHIEDGSIAITDPNGNGMGHIFKAVSP